MNILIYSQQIQELLRDIEVYRGRNSVRVIEDCNRLEQYGRSLNDEALIGYACFSRGETYYLLNDAHNFYSQMVSCLAPMEHIGEWGYLAMANNMLGIMSLNRGNAPFAMDYYIKAMSYCQNYHLPDVEWMVHMNIGVLYINITEYKKALEHLKSSLMYVEQHKDSPEYTENYTAIQVAISKCYLAIDKVSEAKKISDELDNDYMSKLDELSKLSVFCMQSKLYSQLNNELMVKSCIDNINIMMQSQLPIMNMFDDIYDYLQLLLEKKLYKDFFTVYDVIDEITKKTSIKNLEKRLLTLKIGYYRQTNQIEEYKKATALFFEMSEILEKDSRLLVTSMIGMRTSFNEMAKMNRQVVQENVSLQKKSETDPLTGLNNRGKLNEYGDLAFERAKDTGSSFAIEILDIDYFKQYNDNYGHQAGDECIKYIASMIMSLQEHSSVFCARYGGDEFVIIYENMSKEETHAVARLLRERIIEAAIEHKFSKVADVVTISQGICWDMPQSGQRLWDYLHTADNMLYSVKQVSRNSIKLGSCNEDPDE